MGVGVGGGLREEQCRIYLHNFSYRSPAPAKVSCKRLRALASHFNTLPVLCAEQDHSLGTSCIKKQLISAAKTAQSFVFRKLPALLTRFCQRFGPESRSIYAQKQPK